MKNFLKQRIKNVKYKLELSEIIKTKQKKDSFKWNTIYINLYIKKKKTDEKMYIKLYNVIVLSCCSEENNVLINTMTVARKKNKKKHKKKHKYELMELFFIVEIYYGLQVIS